MKTKTRGRPTQAADTSEAATYDGYAHYIVCFSSKLHIRRAISLCGRDGICEWRISPFIFLSAIGVTRFPGSPWTTCGAPHPGAEHGGGLDSVVAGW